LVKFPKVVGMFLEGSLISLLKRHPIVGIAIF